jgi:NADH-quinone oxidoreductase subunit L
MLHGMMMPPFWLAMAGLGPLPGTSTRRDRISRDNCSESFHWAHSILDRKYGFDEFNQMVFAGGSKLLGQVPVAGRRSVALIDGAVVNGRRAGRLVCVDGALHLQTGYALSLRDRDDHRAAGAADAGSCF